VQAAKFGTLYKDGWRFGETNVPAIEPEVVKDESLEKVKTKKRVYVKASGKRKAYSRMQEVGREEVDPGMENLWEITADQFSRLCTGDKMLLKEQYVRDFKYKWNDTHPHLQFLHKLMDEDMQGYYMPVYDSFKSAYTTVHHSAIARLLSHHKPVSVHVIKDYPDLAYSYDIDISPEALAAEEPVEIYEKLADVPKDEYDAIMAQVKEDYDTNPAHIKDADLKKAYPQQLEDVKRAAKLRKKLYNNLPKHLKYKMTPDTMNLKLHKDMVFFASNYNINISDEVKAEYPTIFTDVPFKYEATGNTECDIAANDILTTIRSKVGTDFDPIKMRKAVYDIIHATGKSPFIFTSDMSPIQEGLTESAMEDVSKIIGPDLLKRIEEDGVGVIISLDADRAYQTEGGIHLSPHADINQALSSYNAKTLSHEYGHAIDYMFPEINELSQNFLKNRTEGDPSVQLNELLPDVGYDDTEIVRADNFMNPYIGKIYGATTSEVLSMGMGYLMSAMDMANMYEQDPEYFGYILSVVSGRGLPPVREKDESNIFHQSEVEIDLNKFSRVGLTQKKILVRRKGQAPFWQTRWVQEGEDIRQVVEGLGYEVVEEDKPEKKATLKELVQSAYDVGKAAFEAGLSNRAVNDPKLTEILTLNTYGIHANLEIREGWAKGWNDANAAAPVPGVFDEEPKPESKVPVYELLVSAEAAGRAAFLRGTDRGARSDEEFMNVVNQSIGDDKAFTYLEKAWLAGWDSESDKKFKDQPDNFETMPDVESEPGESPVRGSQRDRPIYARDIPLSERISGTVNVSGVGEVPAITVEDIQIGDKLRFTEGVFTVKTAWSSKAARVGQVGKSRLLVFEEKDSEGENLSLKKQKRSRVGVVTGNVPETMSKPTTVPKPEKKVVKPEPEPEKVTSVPSTGPAKSVPQAISIINDRFINPPETMSTFFTYGVNLDGLKLEHLNSIIDGFDRTLTEYDIRLNYVGWNKRKQSCTAVYQRFGGLDAGISFQKTATKAGKRKQKERLIKRRIWKSGSVILHIQKHTRAHMKIYIIG
jgi:hypothetical protein